METIQSAAEKVPFLLNWYLPGSDKFLIYAYKEIMRWGGENGWTILVVTNALTFLKVMALRTKNVVDDKIVSLLIYFFTGRWITALKDPGTKGNPHVLTEVADDEEKIVKERLDKYVGATT
jgi:hypothetical protein